MADQAACERLAHELALALQGRPNALRRAARLREDLSLDSRDVVELVLRVLAEGNGRLVATALDGVATVDDLLRVARQAVAAGAMQRRPRRR